MKWMMRCGGLLSVLLLAIPGASAGERDDYARQWVLSSTDADAGAYRVTLDRDVYRSVRSTSLGDIEVFNAQGSAVPAALFAPPPPRVQDAQRVQLPWFALPSGPAARAADIAVISERDADGRVRRVETRLSDAAPAAPAADAWLLDASGVRGDIVALELQWSGNATFDVGYRVEGSDDLRSWRTLQPQAQLVDLSRDGRRLQQDRVVLQGSARYLRLLPAAAGQASVPLTDVHAELARASTTDDWQWETLAGHAATDRGATVYAFTLDGRFPVARIDVDTTANDAAEWTLESRDGMDAPWQVRAGPWLAYQVGGGNRSPVQDLGEIVRDRYWRLRSRNAVSGVPTLRLGYRPETVVYLAQGTPPFSLAAGSERAARTQVPLSQLIDGVRAQRGANWEPAVARLGNAEVLSGEDAYTPAPAQRDWKSWLLWALLVGGALVVTGLAVSLLRKRSD